MLTSGPVIVMQLPEQFSGVNVDEFARELKPLFESSRPRIVFDCSQVGTLGSDGVEMLLLCMEEAMKRDGDVKLSSPSNEAAVMLELMRVDRLFETFETSEEAVDSFGIAPAKPAPQNGLWQLPLSSVNALKQAS